MTQSSVKDEARRLIDSLDDDASWDDLVYRIYLQSKLQRGRRESAAGAGLAVEDVRRRLGLRG